MIPAPPTAVHQWSQIIAGLGTVILTVFLVLLYKRQQEQLAAQHEAVLEVSNVEWYDDRAIVWVSNFGNGVAQHLSLVTLVKSDNDDHREYTLRGNALKRIDKEGEWTNIIQPGEENVPFHGKSKVGQLAPTDWPSAWISLSFSGFIRRAKDSGATEVKFCHVVKGAELSGSSCWDRVNPMNQSTNPQKFDFQHSLENLPTRTEHGLDDTFYPYFKKSVIRKWAIRTYVLWLQFFNRVLPKITVRPRELDASGTRRVKRVVLKRQLKKKTMLVKRKVEDGLNEYRDYDWL